jgi:hypothetical protein
VVATGDDLVYQWFKNGALIPGATGASLAFPGAQVSDAGTYTVLVSNPSGSVLSAPARLTVVSAMSVTGLSPANGATDVCIDTPLYITFDQAPRVGTAGRLRVFRADGTLVDTIDLSVDTNPNVPGPQSQRQIGGGPIFHYYPIIVTGDTAAIYLHQALEYGQTYYVTIEPGVFTDAGGAPFVGFSDPNTWRFTTRAAGPPPGTTELTVAADNSGDFCTVQGAIDFVPQNNTQRVVITVRSATYTEINYVRSNKGFITVRGEDRDETVIQYANNNNLNAGVTGRTMFGVDAPDFTLENITLHNTTPRGGSQAEAFRGNNNRIVLSRVNLKSLQDTLLLQNQPNSNQGGFVTDSYIEGDVDFMWGIGTVFFQNCELKAVNPGYYTMVRNPLGKNGQVYVNCRLTGVPGLTNVYLSRIDPNVFPYSQVVFINCAMGPHILPVGWLLNNANEAPFVQFWEYHSTDLDGNPLDVSQRHSVSRQLTDAEAALWSDPAFVLGGWVPAIDISAQVLAESSGLVYNRADQTFHGTITLTNVSTQPVAGPLQIVLTGLTPGVTLVNASGMHEGYPYLTSSSASLAPGASVTVTVQFRNPSNERIGYTVRTFRTFSGTL